MNHVLPVLITFINASMSLFLTAARQPDTTRAFGFPTVRGEEEEKPCIFTSSHPHSLTPSVSHPHRITSSQAHTPHRLTPSQDYTPHRLTPSQDHTLIGLHPHGITPSHPLSTESSPTSQLPCLLNGLVDNLETLQQL